MATMDSSMVNLALPTIMRDFSSPLKDTEWVAMIYLLTITSTLLTWGNLSDRLGRHKIYPAGLLIFAVGSLSCTGAPSLNFLIAARCLQGFGAAMMMATGPAIIKETFPPEQLGRALGLIGAAVSMGLMAGPIVAGFTLQFLSWRVLFIFNVPIGLAFFFLARRLIPQRRQSGDARLYWPAALAWIILLVTISLTITYTSSPIWSKTILSAMAAIVFLLLLSFIFLERRAPFPLIGNGLLRQRYMVTALLCAILSFMVLFAILVITPFFLDRVQNMSKIRIGVVMMAVPMATLILAPLAGWLYEFFTARLLSTLGLLMTTGGAFLLSGTTPHVSSPKIMAELALIGGGLAMFLSPNSASVLRWTKRQDAGKVAALLATGRNMGMMLGIGLASIAFSQTFSRLTHGLDMKDFTPSHTEAFMGALRAVYLTATGAGFLGMVISAMRGKRRP
ncbi:MAG: MFS transporter [Deltaproteobacteria bacterium]|nr:MFS transporter [Deltaproteobacteria bacterium]